LAHAILKIICLTERSRSANNLGIYNFSNLGKCSWFDFAKKIFEINNINIDLKPISTASYPTPAERPKYSVLDKSKIIETFELDIQNWQESLKPVIFPLQQKNNL
jgi:dTDP-4-dehydrorhamnose reductase